MEIIESIWRQRRAVVFEQHIGEALHPTERSSHVVRDAVGKGLQLADGFTQPRCSLGDDTFKFFPFESALCHIHAGADITAKLALRPMNRDAAVEQPAELPVTAAEAVFHF